MNYHWSFVEVFANFGLLAKGLAGTLSVTGVALAFGMPLGLTLAIARLSHLKAVHVPATAVVEIFRTTPPLILLYWFFFAFPILIDVSMTPFVASAVVLAVQSAAFFGEIFRAGIESIEASQFDAGRALGMRPWRVMTSIVLPQATKRMIPSLLERSVELLKTTTLVSAISYADLLFQANVVAQKTFRPLETYTVTAAIYFAIIYTVSTTARALERHLAKSGESTAG